MTPGDEAGALREEEETRVDSADPAADAHDDPAPAEPDPGATTIDDDAGESADEASADTSVETGASAEADAEAEAEEVQEAPVAKTRAEKKAEKAAAKAEKARLKAERAAAAAKGLEAETPAAEETSAEAAPAEAASAEDAAPAEDESSSADAEADEDADVDEDVDVDADEDVDEDESPRPAGAWAISVAALVVLLIAGLVTAGLFWSKASSASADANGKQAAISTARTAVTDLLDVNYKNPSTWTAKLKPLAAGEFLSLINNSSGGLAKILATGKVQTSGKIEDIGVSQYKGDTAQVAVLAQVTVKNSQNPQGGEQVYPVVLSMVESGGKWLVSNMQGVQ